MRSGRVKPGESAGFPRPALYLVLHLLPLLMNSPDGHCRGLGPRDIRGLGNVAGALRRFGETGRCKNSSRELIDGANVDKLALFAAVEDGEDFFLASAQGLVHA